MRAILPGSPRYTVRAIGCRRPSAASRESRTRRKREEQTMIRIKNGKKREWRVFVVSRRAALRMPNTPGRCLATDAKRPLSCWLSHSFLRHYFTQDTSESVRPVLYVLTEASRPLSCWIGLPWHGRLFPEGTACHVLSK